MVLPAKIFEIKDDSDFELMVRRFKDFHEEEPYKTENGETKKLVTEILDLKSNENLISGVFSKDFILSRVYRREVVESIVTEEAPFWIKPFKEKTFIIVMAPSVARGVKKLLTSHVANKFSDIIFSKPWGIVEVRFTHEALRDLHESNPQATKLIWFDNVDIPSVEKLCLAGTSLADTRLYHEYIKRGKIWYVVFEVQKRGIVVGITRSCVVTLFSKSTTDDVINYIFEDLLMLIK